MVGRPEGTAFAALSALVLLLVALAQISAAGNPAVTALAYLPVLACAWFFSRRTLVVVAVLAALLQALVSQLGAQGQVSVGVQIVAIVVVAAVGRLAAVSLVRRSQSERRVQRMSELDRAKSDFMRLASHELRGPVAVVQGYLSMLEDGTLGELPGEARRAVPIMSGRLRTMSALVDQMLDIARLEDSRLQLTRERVDLRPLIEAACQDGRHLAGDPHRLALELGPAPIPVEVDSGRLRTIVGNLLDNAFKYSPDGGPVRCCARLERGQALVTVSDQGVGMDAEAQSRLFTRFGRVVSEENAGIPGTGLGLYLSRELARLHGGDLTVTSAAGRGSTFTLRLPLAAPRPAPTPPEPERRARRREVA